MLIDKKKGWCLAPVGRRFFSLSYELILLLSVSLLLAFVITLVQYWNGSLSFEKGSALFVARGSMSFVIQLFFFFCVGFYFTYCWRQTGQTLAMRSWGIRLICRDARPLHWRRLWLRYFLAFFLFPINFLWIFFDPDRQFLHDRWCRTVLISVDL